MNPQIPDPTLPRYRPITPRPFDIIIEPREFSDSGVGAQGAFFSIITVDDGVGTGDLHLQTGTVNGQGVPQEDLKLYDTSSAEWEGVPGDHLYLEVAGTGVVADGVLLPGFTISGITTEIGLPPGDDPPTKDDPSGTAYLSLGVFYSGGFLPAIVGNRNVAVCIGSFVKTVGA
jgi:hypothetical protein